MQLFYWRAQVLILKLYKGGGDQDLYFCLARFCFVFCFCFLIKFLKGKICLCVAFCVISHDMWNVLFSTILPYVSPQSGAPAPSSDTTSSLRIMQPQCQSFLVPYRSCLSGTKWVSLHFPLWAQASAGSVGGKRWTLVHDWYQRRVRE